MFEVSDSVVNLLSESHWHSLLRKQMIMSELNAGDFERVINASTI